MTRFTSPLNDVKVAAPCSADWDEMRGDEQVRFCGHCNLNVYNLSGMSKKEAESLIARAEGRLCIRFYRRADGTILTRNCPVGLRAIRRRLSRVAGATASAVLSFFAGLGIHTGLIGRDRSAPRTLMGVITTARFPEAKTPRFALPEQETETMGELMMEEGQMEISPGNGSRRRSWKRGRQNAR